MSVIPTASYSAFFYGTLMHPTVLKRVIQNDGSHLQIAPAMLNNYVRLHAKRAIFPAIIPYELAERILELHLPQAAQRVKGVIVEGLSPADLQRINRFEGHFYKRQTVDVQQLQQLGALDAALDSAFFIEAAHPNNENTRQSTMKVFAYVWDLPINDLSPKLWSFEEFVRDKLHLYL